MKLLEGVLVAAVESAKKLAKMSPGSRRTRMN